MPSVIRWSAAACAPLACLALSGPAGAQAPTACPGAQQAPTARTLAAARVATLCLINRERAAQGLPPLTESPVVGWTAQTHSELMVAGRFFAHSKGVAHLLSGVYWLYGQNIAWGDGSMGAPDVVVAAWMASASHRKNILHADFNHIGIGIVMGAPEVTPLSAATYTTDFGAAEIVESADETAQASEAMDSRLIAPAVAPPGAERIMRPPVRVLAPKRLAKACASKSRKTRRKAKCVKRRPRVTIKPQGGRSEATTVVIQPR